MCLPTVRAQGVHPWLRQEQQMIREEDNMGRKVVLVVVDVGRD